MHIVHQFDVSTLNWVKGEIDETLNQARFAFEDFCEDPDEKGSLDKCIGYLHQVLGTLELDRQPVELGQWLRRTVMPWRQAAHDKGLHWRTDLPDWLPVLQIDPDRMAQVLGNLLSNAIKYTPEGSVAVEASVQDGGVAIAVVDTGIGIAPSEQESCIPEICRFAVKLIFETQISSALEPSSARTIS